MSKIFQIIDNVKYELVAHQDGTQALLLNGELFATKESANTSILNKVDSNDVIIVNGTEKVAEGSFTKDGAVVDGLIYDVVTDGEGAKTLFLQNTTEVVGTFERFAEIKIQKAVTDDTKTPAEEPEVVVEEPEVVDNTPDVKEPEPVVKTPDTKEEPTTDDPNGVVEEPAAPVDEIPTDKDVDCVDPSEPQQKEQTSSDHQESESPGGSLAPAVFVPVIVGAAAVVGLGSFVAHRFSMNKKALRAKDSKLSKASKN